MSISPPANTVTAADDRIFLDTPSTVLPTEVLLKILSFTTPTAFIAFSQSCRRFRQLTMPDDYHFMQRLLELELTFEHGGGIPVVNRFGVVDPSLYDDEGWENIRYACCGCLKLRTHRVFDNTAVLKLRLRKPELHMPAANMLAEPGDVRERTRRRVGVEGTRRKIVRKEKKQRGDYSQHSYVPGPDASSHRIGEYSLFLFRSTGRNRHKRLCADCNLNRGRHHGFAVASEDTDLSGPPPMSVQATRSTQVSPYRSFIPVINSRWYSDFAPNSQALAKDHIKCMGRQAAKCNICGKWRALLGFVQNSPRDLCWNTRDDIDGSRTGRWVCWECRNRKKIESGERPEKTIFMNMMTMAVS
ncbi:MAG: F-box protein [Janthinobacterium lividum]